MNDDSIVSENVANELRAIEKVLAWQKAGRAHFIRMLVCAALSFIPALWWLWWAMAAFALTWLLCSYKFWTIKLTPILEQI